MKKGILYILLTVFTFIVLFPFLWMLSTSFKPNPEALSLRFFPKHPTLENFKRIIRDYSFGRYFINSLIVATSAAFFATLFASLASYVFAKKEFPGKRVLFSLFLSSMMVPGLMFMIPQFAIVYRFGWMNTYRAMVVPHLANVFGLFLLTQYMKTLPDSLIEAARIDGASEFQIFLKIILPLSAPVIATVFLLTFQFHWNNFLWQLIVTTSEKMYTVPVGLAMFRSAHEELYSLKMAASTLSIVPIAIIFLFTQRYFIEGLTRGAIKG
ncbi:carbohydrate ABC transporter permease [bacterium]|nr:MAG: carbohydrate ABC transporter permease [bacterium]